MAITDKQKPDIPLSSLHLEQQQSYPLLLLRSWLNAIIRPEIKLKVDFPWDLKEFMRVYAISALCYAGGSILPLLLVFGGIYCALHIAPDSIMPLVAGRNGQPKTAIMLFATVTSFISGFGAELYYLNKQLHISGNNLGQIVCLNLKSLNGNWFEAFRRAFTAMFVAIALQKILNFLPLPHPHQATADLATHLSGAGLVSFAILAIMLAPLFEEIIFRGCLFNAFRKILRQGRIFNLLHHSERCADYMAVGLSAIIFACAHMDVTAFPHLLILGIVLAELYRRSGTLVCSIMLHAINNSLALLLIAMK